MSYYITVRGNGSFSLGPGPIWRGPDSHEITPEQAEQCLAYKDEHPDANLFVISTIKPEVEPTGQPDWILRPEDLAWNRREVEHDEFDRASPDGDYEPEEDDFPCEQCDATYTSAAGLEQHIALKHFAVHERIEDEARAQLAAEKTRKAVAERIRQADPKELHPAERGGPE